jgi:hypothetical protein
LMLKTEYPKGIQLSELVDKVKANNAKSKEIPTSNSSYSAKSVLY